MNFFMSDMKASSLEEVICSAELLREINSFSAASAAGLRVWPCDLTRQGVGLHSSEWNASGTASVWKDRARFAHLHPEIKEE